MTAGISLGSWWAYHELGWGGWWFWDPVENASFMPWLILTALIHSLIISEKRNIFLIKPRFIGLIIEEMERVMEYPKGSTQYVSSRVVRGENVRLYD